MNISECMSHNVRLCAPNDTIQDAARTMKEMDCGLLPVGENDRLVGTISERDIVIRALAAGKPLETPVREVMSHGVEYCLDTDTVKQVADRMSELQVRRMPVLNAEKRLVGIVSVGDIAKIEQSHGGRALKGISKAAVGGAHHAAN